MLKAVRDMVIVKVNYTDKISNIIVPDSAKQYGGDFTGKVIAIGPDYKHDIKVGDEVFFNRHEGYRIRANGEDYLALNSKWIVGKKEV